MAKERSGSASPGSTTPEAVQPAAASEAASTEHEAVPANRTEHANKLVDRFAIWAGAAGLIPVPVVDLVAVGGLQIQMLRRLSQIYNIPFSENRGKSLITSLVGAAIPTSSGLGAAEVLKAIPVVGTLVSALVTPALAAALTYAIGKVFIQHFESGGTLLDFNPPDYREFLQGQKDMWMKRGSSNSPSQSEKTSSEAPAASA